MSYFVGYGDETLHDPGIGIVLTGARLSLELGSSGKLTFTMQANHPLFGELRFMDKEREVIVERDREVLFRGRILSAKRNFNNAITYECEGEMSYLNDAVLRPYSSEEDTQKELAPKDLESLFVWYISKYNEQVSKDRTLEVGINEGKDFEALSSKRLESSSYPSIGQEIKSKLLDNVGGSLRMRYIGARRIIDWMAAGDKASKQKITFGQNLLDYLHEIDALSYCTALIPVGKDAEGEDITIASLPDTALEEGFEKQGDRIIAIFPAQFYGLIERHFTLEDKTTPEALLEAGLRELKNRRFIESIEAKAVDLSLIDLDMDRFTLGDYIHIYSKPHGLDEYLICSAITYDLENPKNDTYLIGKAYDSLTGKQVSDLLALNDSINSVYESAQLIESKVDEIPSYSYVEAVSDSASGSVEVIIDGTPTVIDTECPVKTGDIVYVREKEGLITATGVVGRGDEIRDAVLATQASATQAIEDATQAHLQASKANTAAADAAAQALQASQAAEAAQVLSEQNEQSINAANVEIGNNANAAAQALIEAVTAQTMVNESHAEILSFVEDEYATQGDVGNMQSQLSSRISQTANALYFEIAENVSAIDSLAGAYNQSEAFRKTIYTLSGGAMTIGINDNAQQVKVSPEEISLSVAGVAQTVLTNQRMLVDLVEAKTSLIVGRQDTLGRYILQRKASGNLSLDYQGVSA